MASTELGRPRVVVVSGPSGAGKDTVLGRALIHPGLRVRPTKCVTTTTRAPRPDETDGVDYHFLDRDEFESRIAAGYFLEHAEYAGQLYGAPVASVQAELDAGHCPLLKIEVQGALQVREVFPDCLLVFIAPSTLEELRRRVVAREPDMPLEVLEARMAQASVELEVGKRYDTWIVNDELDRAVEDLVETLNGELAGVATSDN